MPYLEQFFNFVPDMKRFVRQILLFTVAATIFLTGVGVTIINCQCISCDKESLFMSTQQYCCLPNTQSNTEKACCSTGSCHTKNNVEYSNDGHCSISRLSIDIDPSSFRPHVSNPFVWISEALFIPVFNTLPYVTENTDEYTGLKIPPDIPPREYLSLIRVLII